MVTLSIDAGETPAHPGESLLRGDAVVGTITSAAYGHRVGKNLAMAFVDPDCAEVGTALHVEMLGERFGAVIEPACLYDAGNELPRT